MVMYKLSGKLGIRESVDVSLKGMSGMVPLAILMVLAFCKELGTGLYVAETAKQFISPALVPALIFLVACFVAFSTGTSWGTFAIMIAIAVPLAQGMDTNVSLAIAAALGGGVFGDHCSPTYQNAIAIRADRRRDYNGALFSVGGSRCLGDWWQHMYNVGMSIDDFITIPTVIFDHSRNHFDMYNYFHHGFVCFILRSGPRNTSQPLRGPMD